MPDHQLYLNLDDNRWLVARCRCDGWREERMVKIGQHVSDLVRELEEAFEHHAGLGHTDRYTPALPTG